MSDKISNSVERWLDFNWFLGVGKFDRYAKGKASLHLRLACGEFESSDLCVVFERAGPEHMLKDRLGSVNMAIHQRQADDVDFPVLVEVGELIEDFQRVNDIGQG